jgi:hypothetical protein
VREPLTGCQEIGPLDKQVIRVSFLTQDSGLGEAIARALGEDFATRTVNQWQFEQLADVRESSDVILLDLRSANTQGDDETVLRLIDRSSSGLLNTAPMTASRIPRT